MRVPTDATIGQDSTVRRRSSAIRATPFVPSPGVTPTPEMALAGLPSSSSPFAEMQQKGLPPVPDHSEPGTPILAAVILPSPIDDDEVDTDEEDEFFDAIDAGNIPNLVVTKALVSTSEVTLPATVPMNAYEGYRHMRDRLPIDSDNRPPTSLWSVLKHSIGKDLTRISFPVFFNEPTSMLQRMVSSWVKSNIPQLIIVRVVG